MHVDCVCDARASLGEGPLWRAADETLWFTDIKGRSLCRFDPRSGLMQRFDVDGAPGFVVLTDAGGLLVGMDHGLHLFDTRIGAAVAVADMPSHNRLNDGVVDARGRLWFGSMDDRELEPTGAFHRFERGALHPVHEVDACTITNGPAVDAAAERLYTVDTLGRTISRHTITPEGRLTDSALYVAIDPADGFPDGVTCDAEGCVWVALWGGAAVRRYDPAGRLMSSVALPCANVTKVAFGGSDLRTAYVTTARIGLTAADLEAQPLAGGLFAFPADAPGLPSHAVALGA